MSRSGDEMILTLHGLLNKQGFVATAAKKDDEDDKDEKEDKDKDEDKDKKEDKDLPPFMKKKKDDKKAKAAVVMNVLQELTKLASELDEAGADDASSVVDEALRVIVRDLAQDTE